MTSRRTLAVVAASLLAFVFSVLGVSSAVAADVDDFTFESLDVRYTLERDADGVSRMRVVEEFVALFPDTDQNRGMRRIVPDSYQGLPLRPSFESVVDADGEEWDVETEDVDDGVEVVARGDGYLHGAQTFVFTYTLDNVVSDFRDTGLELYWDVNGPDWAQSFGRVSGPSTSGRNWRMPSARRPATRGRTGRPTRATRSRSSPRATARR